MIPRPRPRAGHAAAHPPSRSPLLRRALLLAVAVQGLALPGGLTAQPLPKPAGSPPPALAPTPALAPAAAPLVAAPDPAVGPETLRISLGPDRWSIPFEALRRFSQGGEIEDRVLQRLVARSGWPADALGPALVKSYGVDLVLLARFLYAPEGVAFLQRQTLSYGPLKGADQRVQGLRAAILRDAADGQITALGIVSALPTSYVLQGGGLGDGRQRRCSALPCDNPEQCSSLLSWLAFLPACLQAVAQPAP